MDRCPDQPRRRSGPARAQKIGCRLGNARPPVLFRTVLKVAVRFALLGPSTLIFLDSFFSNRSRIDLNQQVRKMGEPAIRPSYTPRFARQILTEGRYGFSMNRYDKRVRTLAVCLAALAGFVDAIGFIKLGGFPSRSDLLAL